MSVWPVLYATLAGTTSALARGGGREMSGGSFLVCLAITALVVWVALTIWATERFARSRWGRRRIGAAAPDVSRAKVPSE